MVLFQVDTLQTAHCVFGIATDTLKSELNSLKTLYPLALSSIQALFKWIVEVSAHFLSFVSKFSFFSSFFFILSFDKKPFELSRCVQFIPCVESYIVIFSL